METTASAAERLVQQTSSGIFLFYFCLSFFFFNFFLFCVTPTHPHQFFIFSLNKYYIYFLDMVEWSTQWSVTETRHQYRDTKREREIERQWEYYRIYFAFWFSEINFILKGFNFNLESFFRNNCNSRKESTGRSWLGVGQTRGGNPHH